MTFKELQAALEKNFGATRLADIAKELDVSPQVVSNWKSRDQVPYKYVKIFRKKISRLKKESSNFSIQTPLIHHGFPADNSKSDESIIDTLSFLYSTLKSNFYIVIVVPIVISLVSVLYIEKTSSPVFVSTAKILPSDGGSSKSDLLSMASQFGVGPVKKSLDLTSSELYPEIIKSRHLCKLLLKEKFNTKKFGLDQPLLKILVYGNSLIDSSNFHRIQSKGVVMLQKMISVKNTKKNSPLLRLSVYANEAKFSKDLAVSVIHKLDEMQKGFKLQKIQDKLSFIKKRMVEVESYLIKAEESVKTFRDKNRNIIKSPSLKLEEARLLRDVKIQLEIYITLKKEIELAQIEEVENSSMLSILDEPEVPLKRQSPKLDRIFFISLIMGIVIILSFIFGKSWIQENWDSQIKPILNND